MEDRGAWMGETLPSSLLQSTAGKDLKRESAKHCIKRVAEKKGNEGLKVFSPYWKCQGEGVVAGRVRSETTGRS